MEYKKGQSFDTPHCVSLAATEMSVVMARLSSLFFFVLLVILLVSTRSKAKSEDSKKLQHQVLIPLFIFGDSFLDCGNNNYINTTTLDQANFWPYGETYFRFPTGRFSDGRLISDFIAQYANLPLIPPYLQPGLDQYHSGVNFASAGAGALVETFRGSKPIGNSCLGKNALGDH
ncbi:GDSL esterase/lipase 5 [Tripterygium wilfordii]|uniref:GDSL esterase/lipase 5 n=1 Tax=Tripterygium wilfordii TaxID=458696 RepID=A0A7J7CDC6_TRIWF|nr:GDSL esterase/lipase 5 [Tripterygium wilfordii]